MYRYTKSDPEEKIKATGACILTLWIPLYVFGFWFFKKSLNHHLSRVHAHDVDQI